LSAGVPVQVRLIGCEGEDRLEVLLTPRSEGAISKRTMSVILGCAFCGGDAATEAMLVNMAVAGGVSVPYFLRDRIRAGLRRLRGLPSDDGDSCEIAEHTEDAPEA
jgi:hypothetical protein